jgi:hypothetical protein
MKVKSDMGKKRNKSISYSSRYTEGCEVRAQTVLHTVHVISLHSLLPADQSNILSTGYQPGPLLNQIDTH